MCKDNPVACATGFSFTKLPALTNPRSILQNEVRVLAPALPIVVCGTCQMFAGTKKTHARHRCKIQYAGELKAQHRFFSWKINSPIYTNGGFMRYLFVFLFLISGCSNRIHYDPVDWNSKVPKPSEPNPPKPEISPTLKLLLKLHNEQRELKGRSGFVIDPYLCDYAQKHSDWMAEKNRLKHSDIGVLLGKYSNVGENIAWNQRTEVEVVDGWMNSYGHRMNIMNCSFNKIGFGLSYNDKKEPYWCTCFGN